MIDLERERAQTPGCLERVFLDSAGSSLPTSKVVDTVVEHLRREQDVGGYRAAAERREDLAEVPVSLGRLLGCRADEIALADSSTRAWNALVTALRWRASERILICGTEYASNAIALLQRSRADGCSVEVVPSSANGSPDLDAYAALLDERVRLVSLVHVPTNSGQILPVRELTVLAHQVGALVVLDACQSVGQLVLDVDELGVDALTASGRKWLRAPRGTGFLYLRSGVLDDLEPLAADLRGGEWTSPSGYQLRTDAARFELWEHDVAGRLGLGVAVDHLLDLGPADVERTVRAGAAELRTLLPQIAGLTVHDRGSDLSGIVSFTLAGTDPASVQEQLFAAGVTAAVSGAGSTRLDMGIRGLDSVVRLSPHYFNSREDLMRATEAVAAVAGS
ncbi:MAG: aminotransferase class V-fold PLP-dependent enzyme [Actinomycetota bacterium]|nr:aminotransferase class V-fold PLP-dependent enzyme [Actinomycetota bacterium]